MKKTVSTATALSTALVIALGGIALTGQTASAEPAPISEGTVVTPDEDALAGTPEKGAAGVSSETPADVPPIDTVVPDAESTAPAPSGDVRPRDGAPVDEVPGDAVPVETGPNVLAPVDDVLDDEVVQADFELTSPVDGEVLPSAGVVLRGSAPDGSILTVSTSVGTEFSEKSVGGTFTIPVVVEATTEARRVTVSGVGPDGVDLGTIERTVTVAALPTLPTPTITSPRPGTTIEGAPYPSGDYLTGLVTLQGTGVPGATIDLDLQALDPVVPWGYDSYDPAVVRPDGSWADYAFMPPGVWRVTVAQFGLDENGFLDALASPSVGVVVTVTLPAPADSTTVPVTPVDHVTPVSLDRAPFRAATSLASTGSAETTPWVGLAGMALVGLGAATVLVTRRRASRG